MNIFISNFFVPEASVLGATQMPKWLRAFVPQTGGREL